MYSIRSCDAAEVIGLQEASARAASPDLDSAGVGPDTGASKGCTLTVGCDTVQHGLAAIRTGCFDGKRLERRNIPRVWLYILRGRTE